MRKLLLSVMAATAATCVAVPASAQYYHRGAPTPVAMQDMQARVQGIRAHVRELQQRGLIGWREARRFENDASRIDREIWGKSRHGLSYGDRRSIDAHIGELRQRVDMAAARGRYPGRRY